MHLVTPNGCYMTHSVITARHLAKSYVLGEAGRFSPEAD
jgi:hypothetical protein